MNIWSTIQEKISIFNKNDNPDFGLESIEKGKDISTYLRWLLLAVFAVHILDDKKELFIKKEVWEFQDYIHFFGLVISLAMFFFVIKTEEWFANNLAKAIQKHGFRNYKIGLLGLALLIIVFFQIYEIQHFYKGETGEFLRYANYTVLAVYLILGYSLGFIELEYDPSPTHQKVSEKNQSTNLESNIIPNSDLEFEGNNLESEPKIRIRYQKDILSKIETVEAWRVFFRELEIPLVEQVLKNKDRPNLHALYNRRQVVRDEEADRYDLDEKTFRKVCVHYLAKFYKNSTTTVFENANGELKGSETTAAEGSVLEPKKIHKLL